MSNLFFSEIAHYPVASTDNAAFILGGWSAGNRINIIAKFQNNEWTNYGSLHKARQGHNAITSDGYTMIFGGSRDGS